MRLAELILSISRPIGKLGNGLTVDVNVVFRPLSAGCFSANIDESKQHEFFEPDKAADNGFPFLLDKFSSWLQTLLTKKTKITKANTNKF